MKGLLLQVHDEFVVFVIVSHKCQYITPPILPVKKVNLRGGWIARFVAKPVCWNMYGGSRLVPQPWVPPIHQS